MTKTKTKKTTQTMAVALLTFLVQKVGGEAEAMRLFVTDRIQAMVAEGKNLQDMFDTAGREKWSDDLRHMTLGELLQAAEGMVVVPPSKKKISKERSKTVLNRPRITKDESIQLREGVLIYLKENRKGSRSEIAVALGVDSSRLNSQLRGLSSEGLIQMNGKKRGAFYTLKKVEPTTLTQKIEAVLRKCFDEFDVITPAEAHKTCKTLKGTYRQTRHALEILTKQGKLERQGRGEYNWIK